MRIIVTQAGRSSGPVHDARTDLGCALAILQMALHGAELTTGAPGARPWRTLETWIASVRLLQNATEQVLAAATRLSRIAADLDRALREDERRHPFGNTDA
jgi:hypothetical protein